MITEEEPKKKCAKANFKKDFFKLMNNTLFGKTMKNMRNHRGITFVTTETRRNYLVSAPNYHSKKHFFETFISNSNKNNTDTH